MKQCQMPGKAANTPTMAKCWADGLAKELDAIPDLLPTILPTWLDRLSFVMQDWRPS